MAEVRIRRAREVDAAAMAAVVAGAFAPFTALTGVRPAPLRTDWSTVVSAFGARVATRDDAVVGVLVLWPHPDHVLVETVAVAPAAQGIGIGALLLDVAEREAMKAGLNAVRLSTNAAMKAGLNAVRLSTNAAMTENLRWYPRRGYVEVGRGIEHGYDRVRFEKRLLPR